MRKRGVIFVFVFLVVFVLSFFTIYASSDSLETFSKDIKKIVSPPEPPEEKLEEFSKLTFILKDYTTKLIVGDIHAGLVIENKNTGKKTNSLKYVSKEGIFELLLEPSQYVITFKVDIIDIDGTEWVPDYKERFKSYPSYQGSLLTIAAEILERMRKDIAIPFQLEPQTLTRIDETPQMTSLREAIRNALIHQDYQKRNPTQIRRFNDRIEIENPGYSLKPIERIGEPGSELRNPIIARVFSDIGWAEEKGSGIRAMQDAMDKAGLTPPIFESDTGSNLFRVTFRLHHFMTEEDLDWLQEHTEGHNLSDEEKKALILVRHTGSVNNLTYCQINHTDTLTASKSLARLRDKGFLVQSQVKGPGTYYVPAETLPTQTPDLFHPEPIKKTYKEKEESIKNRIAELCRTPHSAKELSLKLGKNRVYLVINYLSKMVKEGKLRRTNPAPKARNQKYFTENNRNHKK